MLFDRVCSILGCRIDYRRGSGADNQSSNLNEGSTICQDVAAEVTVIADLFLKEKNWLNLYIMPMAVL
jgi:hypothetical protein